MENFVYEKDYAEAYEALRLQLAEEVPKNFMETLETTGILKSFDAEWRRIPRTINPENAKKFEENLLALDSFVRFRGGKIRGEIDVKEWLARITLYLPFVDLSTEDILALIPILEGTGEMSIYLVEDNIEISLYYFDYFDLPEDTKSPDEVLMAEIEKVPGLNEIMKEWEEDYYKHMFAFFMKREKAAKAIQEKADEAGMSPEEYFRLLAEDSVKEGK